MDSVQSPIPPSRSFMSLPITPERFNVSDAEHAMASGQLEHHPPPSPSHVYSPRSRVTPRGAAGNLERDLQRLQDLLRRSPLTRAFSSSPAPASGRDGDEPGARVAPSLRMPFQQQQQSPQFVWLPNTHGASAAALGGGEKRTRDARRSHVSASPVTPEVKRDRREATGHSAVLMPAASPSPPRRSTVLDAVHEEEEWRGSGAGSSDAEVAVARAALASFSRAAAGAHGGGGVGDGTSTSQSGTSGFLDCPPHGNADVLGATQAMSAGADAAAEGWRRSPVRWYAAAEPLPGTPLHGDAAAEETQRRAVGADLRVSALDAWMAHQSPPPPRQNDVHPEVTHGDTSHFFAAAVPSASPPPRAPLALSSASASPLPRATPSKNAAAAATGSAVFLTPALDEGDVTAQSAASAPPRQPAAPPPPVTADGTGGIRGTPSWRASAESKPPAASSVQSDVPRFTSWQALRAYHARQLRSGLVRTPSYEEAL